MRSTSGVAVRFPKVDNHAVNFIPPLDAPGSARELGLDDRRGLDLEVLQRHLDRTDVTAQELRTDDPALVGGDAGGRTRLARRRRIASITGLVAPPYRGVTGSIVGVGPPQPPRALSCGSLGVATVSVGSVKPHDVSSDQL